MAAPKSSPSGDSSSIGQSVDHYISTERLVDLRKIQAIVWKNWLVLKGDKVRLIPLMMFPLIMLVIFGYSTGNVPKNLPAAVVDYDHSSYSQSLLQELSALQTFSFSYHVSSQEEGKALMNDGKIKVLVILPAGLGNAVAHNQSAMMQVMVDESDSSVATIGKSTMQSFAQRESDRLFAQRLSQLQGQLQFANARVAQARSALLSVPNDPASNASASRVSATVREMHATSATAASSLDASIQALHNSLGYLIDQNEVIGAYSPSSQGQAALVELATADNQQSVLQTIAFDQGMQGATLALAADGAKLYSAVQSLQAQQAASARASSMSVQMLDSAGHALSAASSNAQSASSPLSLTILEPYGYGRQAIDFLLPAILALIIFQGASAGLGRAIAGERRGGALTRVFLTPTSNITIILGTQLFYLILETIRSSLIIFAAIALFGVSISGSIPDIVFIIAIYALGATGIGMVLSVLTKTEDQYMAMAMLISLPMMFLSGAFFPIQTMPPALQSLAGVLPVSYAGDALRGVMVKGFTLSQVFPDLVALAIFGMATFTLTIMFFKRELV